MGKILITFLAVLLSRCFPSKQEQMREHRSSCYGYGFKPGTVELAQCIQKESLRIKEEDAKFFDNMFGKQTTCVTKGNKTTCNQF